jgi:hypothetical protein
MRLPQLDHTTLEGDQLALYEDMKAGIHKNFAGFTAIDAKEDLIGPWNPWLSFPKFGGPVWKLVLALGDNPLLPKPIREIGILVTGAHFHSAYELYAHILVAKLRGLSDAKVRTISSGNRPADLTEEEGLAYDFAYALVNGGSSPKSSIARWRTHSAAMPRRNSSISSGCTAWSPPRSTASRCPCPRTKISRHSKARRRLSRSRAFHARKAYCLSAAGASALLSALSALSAFIASRMSAASLVASSAARSPASLGGAGGGVDLVVSSGTIDR